MTRTSSVLIARIAAQKCAEMILPCIDTIIAERFSVLFSNDGGYISEKW